MSEAKWVRILGRIGSLGAVVSFFWGFMFYAQSPQAQAEGVGGLFSCVLMSSGTACTLAGLSARNNFLLSYSPAYFWASIALLLVAFVLNARAKARQN